MRKAVSTAEKRAELERLGEEWPLYPDGTRQYWKADASCCGGGRWTTFAVVKKARGRAIKWSIDNPEKRRKSNRKRRGRLPEERPLTSAESSARAIHAQSMHRCINDPMAMEMLEERNPRRAKLIRLALHPTTPPFEKRRALDKLMPKEHTHGS